MAKTEVDSLGEEQLGKLGEEEEEPGTEQRREYIDLGESDDRRGMSGSRDVSLLIFITFMSGSKSLTSFAYCFFHFRRPPGLRLVFDAIEKNGKFGRIQRNKESGSRERGEYSSGEAQLRAEVAGKVIPTSSLKIKGILRYR